MDRPYKHFKSDEIVISDQPPTGVLNKPAGAFARLQKRQWKIWYQVNDLYNVTSVVATYIRQGVDNDWFLVPSSTTTTPLIPQPIINLGYNYRLQHSKVTSIAAFMAAASTNTFPAVDVTQQNLDWANDPVQIALSYPKGDWSVFLANQPLIVMEVYSSGRRYSRTQGGDRNKPYWSHPANIGGTVNRTNSNYGGGGSQYLDTEWPLLITEPFAEQILIMQPQNFYRDPSLAMPVNKTVWAGDPSVYSLRSLNKRGFTTTNVVSGYRQPVRFRFAMIDPLDSRSVILGTPSEVVTIQPKGGEFTPDADSFWYDWDVQRGY